MFVTFCSFIAFAISVITAEYEGNTPIYFFFIGMVLGSISVFKYERKLGAYHITLQALLEYIYKPENKIK